MTNVARARVFEQRLADLLRGEKAAQVLTRAGRRRKDRPDRLLHQIRHDRAELYERVGRKAQARREFEKLYVEAPEFEGLAERLGLR